MNRLFEKFIYKILKAQEEKYTAIDLKIHAQNSVGFWGVRNLKPDIIIEYTTNHISNRVIIDTKWKKMPDCSPSLHDLRQMFAYNIQANSLHAVLLYPYNGFYGSGKIFFEESRRFTDKHACEVYFARLFEDKVNAEAFATEFINYLIK